MASSETTNKELKTSTIPISAADPSPEGLEDRKSTTNPIKMTSKFPESVPDLMTSLHHLRSTNPKAVRSTIHLYPAEVYANNGEGSSTGHERERRITSWKMTEHMYRDSNNPFPTMARGLFTEEVEDGDEIPPGIGGKGDGERKVPKERIVARGYDKFFNIDEVAWTNWEAMKRHTEPPYYLTLKSNGCLILISALSPSHLLVASKHSLGTTTEAEAEAALADGIQDVSLEAAPRKDQSSKVKGKAVDRTHGGAAAGPAEDNELTDRAHAAVGREWVKRTLEKSGKTEAELARRLWDDNLTAVLELCDDEFEEHVMATPEYWTGLHLHGLNRNTPHFATLPPDSVSAFAEEFGFIPTKVVKLDTLAEVRAFTDDVAKTGSWEGDMIEGFVVRSAVRAHRTNPTPGVSQNDPDEAPEDHDDLDRPPYKPGAPFFFKIKFDEPYLLYRQWREITRVMLPLLEPDLTQEKRDDIWQKVRKRVKRPEVALYADWVGRTIKAEPKLFDDYNRGIVRVRDRFLAWTEMDGEGQQAWKGAQAGNYKLQGHQAESDKGGRGAKKGGNKKEQVPRDIVNLPKKFILVPIAVPGCGKTLVGLTLAKLYGFGHTQSDDVTTKRSAPTFLKNISALLKTHDVVYADRNNHLDKHYKELAALHNAKELSKFNVRLIGILWDIEKQPYHKVLRKCSERVVGRGDNHQTLRPDLSIDAEHEAIVGKFLRDFTTPDEELFDGMIDVSVDDTPGEAISQIISGLATPLGFADPAPSEMEISSALDEARGYKVTTPYHPPDKSGRSVRYFGLAPEVDLVAIVEIGVYFMPGESAQSAQRFLSSLQSKGRVISSPHITLVHETNVKQEKEALLDGAGSGPASGQGEGDTAEKEKEKDESKESAGKKEGDSGTEAGTATVTSIQKGLQQRAWDTCVRLTEKQVSAMWEFDMTHLVWDKRVMAIVVDDLAPAPTEIPKPVDQGGNVEGVNMEDLQVLVHEETKEGIHITVGTQNEEIRPYEARGLVELVRKRILTGEDEGEGESPVEGGGVVRWAKIGAIKGEGRIKGMW